MNYNIRVENSTCLEEVKNFICRIHDMAGSEEGRSRDLISLNSLIGEVAVITMRNQGEIVALCVGGLRDDNSVMLVKPGEWEAGRELIESLCETHLRDEIPALHARYTQASISFFLERGFTLSLNGGDDFGYVFLPLRKVASPIAKRRCLIEVSVVSRERKIRATKKVPGYIHESGNATFREGFCMISESRDRVTVDIAGRTVYSGTAKGAERIGFHCIGHTISTCFIYVNAAAKAA